MIQYRIVLNDLDKRIFSEEVANKKSQMFELRCGLNQLCLQCHLGGILGVAVANDDPRGYYRALNVATDATDAAIKTAYRNLAKKLHPDLNGGVDTTAAFQIVQEAYNVLGHDDSRAKYDASGAAPSSQSQPEGGYQRHINPVICSECGCVTAQPRFKVFYLVISYLLGAYKNQYKEFTVLIAN